MQGDWLQASTGKYLLTITAAKCGTGCLWSQNFPLIGDRGWALQRRLYHLVERALWIYPMISCIFSNPEILLLHGRSLTLRWFGFGFGGFLVSLKLYNKTNCLYFLFKWIQMINYLIRQCIKYILCPTYFRREWAAFSGCVVFSINVQKLFCGSCSAFKWSFDEYVGEKVVSLSYSSAILNW